jgi:hypothetical protein
LRGYFDGDGMIRFDVKRGSLVIKITTGSPFILDDISDTITRLLGIDRHEPQARTQIRHETFCTWYELTYCGACATKICDVMYKHSGDLYLSRKRQAFFDYVNRHQKHGLRNNGNATKYH